MNHITFGDLEQNVDYFRLHYPNTVHCSTRKAHAVLLKGLHLKSTVMELPAAEVVFSKGNNFRITNGIVIRKHGHNMLEIVVLEDG